MADNVRNFRRWGIVGLALFDSRSFLKINIKSQCLAMLGKPELCRYVASVDCYNLKSHLHKTHPMFTNYKFSLSGNCYK